MSIKRIHTEKNIQKLISSALNDENRLDKHHKEVVLDLLLEKMDRQTKRVEPKPASIIALSTLWIAISILVFAGFTDSMNISDLLKAALGLSMLFIPVSSIVLIISKLRSNEKTMVS